MIIVKNSTTVNIKHFYVSNATDGKFDFLKRKLKLHPSSMIIKLIGNQSSLNSSNNNQI